VPAHSSIKTGILVGCGITDGDIGFGLVHLKTEEKSADASGVHDDHLLSNFLTAGLAQGSTIAIIPQVSYLGKGSNILFSGHMGTNKIKLDYGGFIHIVGKQWFKTVDGYLHVASSSDEDWDHGTLLLHD